MVPRDELKLVYARRNEIRGTGEAATDGLSVYEKQKQKTE